MVWTFIFDIFIFNCELESKKLYFFPIWNFKKLQIKSLSLKLLMKEQNYTLLAKLTQKVHNLLYLSFIILPCMT